jgi:phosphoribosylglycinamide formyltransferase 1
MAKKIIILTSTDIRHQCFRTFLSNQKGIKVLKSFSETGNPIFKKKNRLQINKIHPLMEQHAFQRRQMEKDIFGMYLSSNIDKSNNLDCENGFSSSKEFLNIVKKLNPDLIVVYGSSIIKGDILNIFKHKIINVHLGLSPYYRGSGTNYFPFVNKEPEFSGATFMYLDKTIDNGTIIHQIRSRISTGDSFHQIGNRLISDMFQIYYQIILNFNKIKVKKKKESTKGLLYKRKDFTLSSIEKLKKNFKKGIIEKYLKNKKKRDQKVPLIVQKFIK